MDRSENDLKALEARLGAWRPAASPIDRDRLLFLAGKAAAGSEIRGRIAGGAVVGLALLAAGMGGMWASERGQRVKLEAIVAEHVREARPNRVERIDPPATASPPSSSYLVMSQKPEELGDTAFAPTVSLSPPRQGPVDREPPLSPMSARGAESMFR